MPIVETIEELGAFILDGIVSLGNFLIFLANSALYAFLPPYKPRLAIRQIRIIGADSLFLILLIGTFTGMVLGLQGYNTLRRFGSEGALGTVVALVLVRELGPVLAGLMVAGRIGAAMAAEIGTMRVTEQIDALTTLSTDPIKYLVAPRLLASVVTMPILVAIADSIGVFGGYIVATKSLGFNGYVYLKNSVDFVTDEDVYSGLIKAAVFGFIIALMGCYNGFNSKGGAQGVGAARWQGRDYR